MTPQDVPTLTSARPMPTRTRLVTFVLVAFATAIGFLSPAEPDSASSGDGTQTSSRP